MHGYLLARQLKSRSDSVPVMAYSTVYRCLDRLEERGLIESSTAADQRSGGPPRRVFRLTDAGRLAAAALPDDELGFDLSDEPDRPGEAPRSQT